jgi:hypothetical protein
MDLTNSIKPILISAGIGGHYVAGVDRLERSLMFEGWAGDMRFWRNEYPYGCLEHGGDGQYNFKVHCFNECFLSGRKVVVWADASFWNVRNPMPLFDYVNDNGLYFFKSGYLLAETATDKLCEYAQVTRDELIGNEVSEFATGLVGINIDNPNGKEFFEHWKQYMEDGMFGGNRAYDINDSHHPIFKFSRQDQSAASMILYKMGIKTCGEDRDYQAYKGTGYNPDKILFFIGGL